MGTYPITTIVDSVWGELRKDIMQAREISGERYWRWVVLVGDLMEGTYGRVSLRYGCLHC